MNRSMDWIEAREQAWLRATELANDARDYLEACRDIETGEKIWARALERKKQILDVLGGSEKDWDNWKWQVRNRVNNAHVLQNILGLSYFETKAIEKVSKRYRWAVSPYYLSLVGQDYRNSPVYKQAVPDIRELESWGNPDPMNEALTSPASRVTRRYPDRLIINVTNQCAMYCRHCQRRRNIGEIDQHAGAQDIREALRYVRDNKEIRDVLLTGGDALMLSDRRLQWLLEELDRIPHVEIKRIGTRVPVTLPQRITEELCEVLRKHPPIYINTQFNHPVEVTPTAKEACDKLVQAGVVMGNQAVMLKGINDDPYVMRKLNHELLKIRVRPYYIFHAKPVLGTRHWQTSVKAGLEIMESLRGHTSGLAVPTYIYNAPGGLGKIPLMPNYVVRAVRGLIILRTWEGHEVRVEETDA